MDWNAFFEKTLQASGVESYAKLAPKLGVSDGAISHYRTGKRTPQAWVVAAALRIQGSEQPEREAADLMKAAAPTSTERSFWKRLASAAALVLYIGAALPSPATAHVIDSAGHSPTLYIMSTNDWLDLALAGTPIFL
jgi:hypothetical protein